jgi:flagellar biosynthesis/type III secretory pathway M-ring protein FliF/YscJ
MEDWEKRLALEKLKFEERNRSESSRQKRHQRNLVAMIVLLIMAFVAFFVLYRVGQARLNAYKSSALTLTYASFSRPLNANDRQRKAELANDRQEMAEFIIYDSPS